MNVSKTSGNQIAPKRTKQVHSAGHAAAMAAADVIVVTVDAALDKLTSVEKVTPKTNAAKKMFANYRNGL
jgi:hypothetical protein